MCLFLFGGWRGFRRKVIFVYDRKHGLHIILVLHSRALGCFCQSQSTLFYKALEKFSFLADKFRISAISTLSHCLVVANLEFTQ